MRVRFSSYYDIGRNGNAKVLFIVPRFEIASNGAWRNWNSPGNHLPDFSRCGPIHAYSAISALTVGPIHSLSVFRKQSDVTDFWIRVLMVTMIQRSVGERHLHGKKETPI